MRQAGTGLPDVRATTIGFHGAQRGPIEVPRSVRMIERIMPSQFLARQEGPLKICHRDFVKRAGIFC